MKSRPTAGIVVIVLGALIALIPSVIFPVCKDMIQLTNGKALYMRCHWTAMAELLMGVLIAIDGVLIIAFKKFETRLALNIMLFPFGLTALLIPTTVIGMCETITMPCRIGTKPALIVVSVIIMILAIGNIVTQISSMKSEKKYKERSAFK